MAIATYVWDNLPQKNTTNNLSIPQTSLYANALYEDVFISSYSPMVNLFYDYGGTGASCGSFLVLPMTAQMRIRIMYSNTLYTEIFQRIKNFARLESVTWRRLSCDGIGDKTLAKTDEMN